MEIKAYNFKKGDILVPADLTYPEGALRVDSFDGDTLKAHPESGGFGYEIPFAALRGYDFKVVDVEKFKATWRKAKFSIDDGPEFEGYHWGQRWNGWACPQFTIEVMREIAEWTNKDDWTAITIDDNGTVTITVDEDFPEVDEGDERARNGIPTMRLYGFSGWCWDAVEGEE